MVAAAKARIAIAAGAGPPPQRNKFLWFVCREVTARAMVAVADMLDQRKSAGRKNRPNSLFDRAKITCIDFLEWARRIRCCEQGRILAGHRLETDRAAPGLADLLTWPIAGSRAALGRVAGPAGCRQTGGDALGARQEPPEPLFNETSRRHLAKFGAEKRRASLG